MEYGENCRNVSVVIRVRPLDQKEETEGIESIISTNQDQTQIALVNPKNRTQEKCFQFQKVFLPNATQYDIYNSVGVPIVETIFNGYNGTIFAYGQTGTGKTYTMSGTDTHGGILPKTFTHIFNKISTSNQQKSFAITATFIEIYNEEIRDLLSTNPNAKLELRERTDIGVYVKDLTGFTVDKPESMMRLMQRGNNNRVTRSTALNELSSRSHAIFTIIIEVKDNQRMETTIGKLNLVDLAGSERLSRSGASGSGLKEASNINQSLFCLSNVISALVECKCTHIPYRNSKLTRLLQDSLGGNSQTAMIATISPSIKDYEESLCTLRYATKTKCVVNSLKQNIQIKSGLIESFEKEIKELQDRLAIMSPQRQRGANKTVRKSRRSVTNLELEEIEEEKRKLNEKVTSIQGKILVGGKNLLEEAQKQENLIKETHLEISHLRDKETILEDQLQLNETKCTTIRKKYSTLEKESDFLDKNIEMLEKNLVESEQLRLKESERHSLELEELGHINQSLKRELKLVNKIIEEYIPPNELAIIQENTRWNTDTTDFHTTHIAYAGNNLMENEETKSKKIITAQMKNPYGSYSQSKSNKPAF